MGTTQPIRDVQEIRQLLDYFLEKGELRNHVMVVIGVYTALRICDILSLVWDDVYDFEKQRVFGEIQLVEQKTGKSKIIALNEAVREALGVYAEETAEPGKAVLANPRTGKAISREQAYKILRVASETLGLSVRVSCHSLRKTFGYHAMKGGIPPATIMDIYNHKSFAVTLRYLGITQDDINAVYLGLDFFDQKPKKAEKVKKRVC